MTRTTTGRNKATQRSEERSRAERRRGEQTLMLPRRPQMLRQLQTSPLRSPLLSLAPRSEEAARRERRNKEEHDRGTDLRAPMSHIFLPLALCLFLLSPCCSFSTRRRRWFSPSVRAAPDAVPWGRGGRERERGVCGMARQRDTNFRKGSLALC